MVTPRRLSITTRRNSLAIGSDPSRTMVSTDCDKESPAERLPDINCKVSARPIPNAFSRRFFFLLR